MPDGVVDDDDLLDGCELDFEQFAVDEETQELLPLFPDGVATPEKVAEWQAVMEMLGEQWMPPEARYSDDHTPNDPEIEAEG